MKQKTLTIILGMILLVGIVTATTLTNVSEQLVIPDFIAGDTTSTEFSFDYPDVEVNYNNAPLVARINISCVYEEEDCPLNDCSVWKGDFQFSMVAKQYLFGGLLGDLIHYNTIPMTCSEQAPIEFKAKDKQDIQYSINDVPDGTFYCYNPNYYMLQLDSHDDITLSISSDPALYPGEYSVSVELLEMEPDNYPPIIKLNLEKTLFNENDIIPIRLNVSDMYNIDYVEYEIINPELSENFYASGWISTNFNSSSELYEDDFVISEHSDLNTSGTYWIKARACDVLGNCGDL